MATQTHSELRLQTLLDERAQVHRMHETVIGALEANESNMPSDSQTEQINSYREKADLLDKEITELTTTVEAAKRAEETSRSVRRMLAGNTDGIDMTDDGIVYRDFYTFARDMVLSRSASLAKTWSDDSEVAAMVERQNLLKRTPANTLSSNVGGLQPAQHIAQIFQVIDSSRRLVATAKRATLERGQLTFPKITQRPVVAVQASEKTEGGNTGLVVEMETANAATYLGGGDISWQAINWSTPDTLRLWFDVAASDYALKTETDAATVVTDAGALNVISTKLDGTDTYDDWVAAIMAGASEVYANSGRMVDTIYVAPDQFYAFAALIPTTFAAAFVNGQVSVPGQSGGFAGMSLVASRGLAAGVAVVGDSQALIVAETAGAPVELRVVEPAIGGVEVGIIGAFEAVVVEDEAFSLLTTAS